MAPVHYAFHVLLPVRSDDQAHHGREGTPAQRIDEDHGTLRWLAVECVVREEHAAASALDFDDHGTALCE